MYPSRLGSFYVSGKLPQRPLCVLGRVARGKKESARGTMGREKRGSEAHFSPLPIVPRAIYFSIIVIFIGIPSGSLCAVERKYAGFWNISLENVRRAVSPNMTKYPCRVSEVDLDPSRSENEHLLVVHLIAKS